MNKLLQHKFWWLWLVLFVLGMNLLAAKWHKRFDLTADKRYSLSKASKEILRNLPGKVKVEVFLKGRFPADFKRLADATREFLDECREYAGNKLDVVFTEPFEGLDKSAAKRKVFILDSIYGLTPRILNDPQLEAGLEQKQQVAIPGAIVSIGNRIVGVHLLKGLKQNSDDDRKDGRRNDADLYNRAAATLEYKFLDAIDKVTAAYRPRIGYAIGHGQPGPALVNDAISSLTGHQMFPPPPPGTEKDTLNSRYIFTSVNIRSLPYIPESLDALLMVKPSQPFSDYDKLKLDQYIMNGGKVFWMIDNMYAEFDSLMRSNNQSFIAFDRALNLDDLLFRYGVRINQNLLQDMQSDVIPLQYGDEENNQSQLFPFPFFPLLNGNPNNPITKNLNGIRGVFPNTIDTVQAEGIQKTVLLTSSQNARVIGAPYKVDFEFMQYTSDPKMFQVKDTAVAVLLEGPFRSFFANRLSAALNDSLKAYGRTYLDRAKAPGKMIVVADGDIALNQVSQLKGPLPMGANLYTKSVYANKDFYLNCIAYLTGNAGILQTRTKELTLRLLDPVKKEKQAGKWRMLAVVAPVALVLIAGFLFGWMRKKRYGLAG